MGDMGLCCKTKLEKAWFVSFLNKLNVFSEAKPPPVKAQVQKELRPTGKYVNIQHSFLYKKKI
jgi:hypothetical protein